MRVKSEEKKSSLHTGWPSGQLGITLGPICMLRNSREDSTVCVGLHSFTHTPPETQATNTQMPHARCHSDLPSEHQTQTHTHTHKCKNAHKHTLVQPNTHVRTWALTDEEIERERDGESV